MRWISCVVVAAVCVGTAVGWARKAMKPAESLPKVQTIQPLYQGNKQLPVAPPPPPPLAPR